MSLVVFLGPSLARDVAWSMIEAEFLPPVKRGDLLRLGDEVGAVAIIDGVFHSESAVGHREILHLLRSGRKVYGSSSMGALRAYELRDFGMVGVGRIYELYADGIIDGDDEVALIFNPETLEPLSEPLVNLRLNLLAASAEGVISGDQADRLIASAKGLFYPKRTKGALLEAAGPLLGEEASVRLARFFAERYEDFKRTDALALLRMLKSLEETAPSKGSGRCQKP